MPLDTSELETGSVGFKNLTVCSARPVETFVSELCLSGLL